MAQPLHPGDRVSVFFPSASRWVDGTFHDTRMRSTAVGVVQEILVQYDGGEMSWHDMAETQLRVLEHRAAAGALPPPAAAGAMSPVMMDLAPAGALPGSQPGAAMAGSSAAVLPPLPPGVPVASLPPATLMMLAQSMGGAQLLAAEAAGAAAGGCGVLPVSLPPAGMYAAMAPGVVPAPAPALPARVVLDAHRRGGGARRARIRPCHGRLRHERV